MRENRPYGSEGGEGDTFPTPIRDPPPRWGITVTRCPFPEPCNLSFALQLERNELVK